MAARNPLPPDEAKPRISKDRLNRSTRIFEYVLLYKWLFALSFLILGISSVIFLAILQLPGEAINVYNGEGKYGLTVNEVFLVIAGLVILQAPLSYFRVRIQTVVSERAMSSLRKDLFAKLLSLSVPFFERTRVGELTSRITNDISQLQSLFSLTLTEFTRQIIILIGASIFILFTMFKLALVSLVIFPVVVVAAMFFGKYVRKMTKARQEKIAESNVIVDETLQSIPTVKAYTNESFELERYGRSIDESVAISIKTANARGLFSAFIVSVMFGALFLILYRAMLLVESGDLPVGDLFSFIVFTGIIGGSVASLGNFYGEIVGALGASDRVVDILESEESEVLHREARASRIHNGLPEVLRPHENSLELRIATETVQGSINYDNVTFSYPTRPDITVLKGIDFHVAPGEKVALVGASGSGKSTIVKLLLRFYPITGGEITVDGSEINDYDLEDYRDLLALVPQEVLLFGGTIRENIAYGRLDATEAEIRAAADKANALEFINGFPEGLDTVVGDRGIQLSGGQRQRVAIARAILKDPKILLLDEATSSLDAESERVVQGALDNLMEGRTSIIIAHRLATIRDVDRIYVIEAGRIVESGTHSELSVKPHGAYSALARLQFDLAE